MSVTISESTLEKAVKRIDEAVAISALLENDLGVQKDISSANAVCVIGRLMDNAKELIETAAEGNGGAADEDV